MQFGESRMPRRIALLAQIAIVLSLARIASADESIARVNNQDSLAVGLAPLRDTEEALTQNGGSLVNSESGTLVRFGYERARTRTILGFPGWYTDLLVSLSAGNPNYAGSIINRATGATGAIDEPVSLVQEAVRFRVGRSVALNANQTLALTPYVGASQEAWARETSGNTRFADYDHQALEVGTLAQASISSSWVLGADAGVGRTLGAVLLDGSIGNRVWLNNATTASFALSLDHRTFDSWHQRLEVRQSYLRYGQPANVVNFFEPRRSSDLAIMLEFGTETSFF
jgi:hypothetical protein